MTAYQATLTAEDVNALLDAAKAAWCQAPAGPGMRALPGARNALWRIIQPSGCSLKKRMGNRWRIATIRSLHERLYLDPRRTAGPAPRARCVWSLPVWRIPLRCHGLSASPSSPVLRALRSLRRPCPARSDGYRCPPCPGHASEDVRRYLAESSPEPRFLESRGVSGASLHRARKELRYGYCRDHSLLALWCTQPAPGAALYSVPHVSGNAGRDRHPASPPCADVWRGGPAQ